MTNTNNTIPTGSSQLPGDAPKNASRPEPSRWLSEGETHVLNAKPASKPSAPNNIPSATAPASSSKARTHFAFSSTTQFQSGLDWLLDATKESERRQPPTLRGTPLTEDSLRVWNRSDRPPPSHETRKVHTTQTGSSSGATTRSSDRDASRE